MPAVSSTGNRVTLWRSGTGGLGGRERHGFGPSLRPPSVSQVALNVNGKPIRSAAFPSKVQPAWASGPEFTEANLMPAPRAGIATAQQPER
jgi:hypothetical protein